MYLKLAARNGVKTEETTPDAIRAQLTAMHDLPSFIRIYTDHMAVLQTEQDFYELAFAYFQKVHHQNVVYLEMFFDPQMHTSRGIPFATVIHGIDRARQAAAQQFGMEIQFILCFNRDRSVASAEKTLRESLPFKDKIIGLGLDNLEEPGFPKKYKEIFRKGKAAGYRLTSHCDAGDPLILDHIRGCFQDLHVERIDHGYDLVKDPALVAYAREHHIGLTLCPTQLYRTIPGRLETRTGIVKQMLDLGLLVTINSDDPGYMRSLYVGDLYGVTQKAAGLSRAQIITLAENAFKIAWLPEARKQAYLRQLAEYVAKS
jgi:adenosine deaminase